MGCEKFMLVGLTRSDLFLRAADLTAMRLLGGAACADFVAIARWDRIEKGNF